MLNEKIISDSIGYQWSHHCELEEDAQLEGIIGNLVMTLNYLDKTNINEKMWLEITTIDRKALLKAFD